MRGVKQLFSNCKEATLLTVKSEEVKLSFPERVQLGIHLLYCSTCRRFKKESEKLNVYFLQLHEHLLKEPPYRMSEQLKATLQSRLKK
ncbi:MAG TPA: hypothetical protein VK202_00860 [Bacteroidia bacterium]|nr:hypothetical protein [Bacteroidia bacterium]